jgi:hypothetical protein
MTSKHTPGPWAWERREDYDAEHVVVFDPQSDNGDILALVDHEETRADLDQSADANARLMAAAPEMLQALQNLRSLFDNDSPLLTVYLPEIEACEVAIIKATGGADFGKMQQSAKAEAEIVATLAGQAALVPDLVSTLHQLEGMLLDGPKLQMIRAAIAKTEKVLAHAAES